MPGAGDRHRRRPLAASSTASCSPVESWNAQISLLTGFAAAPLMVEGAVGHPAHAAACRPADAQRLRRTARALRIDWPDGPCSTRTSSARSTRPARPTPRWWWPAPGCCGARVRRLQRRGARAARARGAGLAVRPRHGAAAPAGRPLRREICAALCAGTEVPQWVLDRLTTCRPIMRDSGRRASAYEGRRRRPRRDRAARAPPGRALRRCRGRGDREGPPSRNPDHHRACGRGPAGAAPTGSCRSGTRSAPSSPRPTSASAAWSSHSSREAASVSGPVRSLGVGEGLPRDPVGVPVQAECLDDDPRLAGLGEERLDLALALGTVGPRSITSSSVRRSAARPASRRSSCRRTP